LRNNRGNSSEKRGATDHMVWCSYIDDPRCMGKRNISVCVCVRERERESIQRKIDIRYVRRGKGIRLSRGLSSGRGS